MLCRGRNREYSFYLGPVCHIGFVLLWLFWLGAEADPKYGSLLNVVPKIPEGGYLSESITTGQAFKKCPRPSKSQQKPTTQKLPPKLNLVLLNGFYLFI